jgi:hypothetical protein
MEKTEGDNQTVLITSAQDILGDHAADTSSCIHWRDNALLLKQSAGPRRFHFIRNIRRRCSVPADENKLYLSSVADAENFLRMGTFPKKKIEGGHISKNMLCSPSSTNSDEEDIILFASCF